MARVCSEPTEGASPGDWLRLSEADSSPGVISSRAVWLLWGEFCSSSGQVEKLYDGGDEGSSGGSEDGVGIIATERTLTINDDGGQSPAQKTSLTKLAAETPNLIAVVSRELRFPT